MDRRRLVSPRCPLDAAARDLLLATVDHLFDNAAHAVLETHGGGFPSLAFGASLVGVDERVLSSATIAVPCAGTTTFDPTCEPGLAAGHDRCFRLGCDGEAQYFVDVYFVAPPQALPEPRHELTVDLEQPAGAVSTYAENPFIRWESDLLDADNVVNIHADVDVAHVVTLEDGAVVDLTHTGTVDGSHVFVEPDDQVSLQLALTFPQITATGASVTLEASADGQLTGAVTVEGAELGTIDAPIDLAEVVPVAWTEACGD